MTLAELKAMIEAEALKRQAARDGFTLDAVKAFLSQGMVQPPPPPEPLTYGYFASLNGRALVTSCYTTLLGRGPDPGGMDHYLKLLARGDDKALVIGRIRYFGEGRKRGVPVMGLAPRFAIAAAKKVPIAGQVFAWLVALVTLHLRQREANALEHRLHSRIDAIGEYVSQSGARIATRIDALRSVMEERD